MTGGNPERGEIVDAVVDEYPRPQLTELGRPPSRGGNGSAEHRHVMWISGVAYSFLAPGFRKWVYKGDRVSFQSVVRSKRIG